MLTRLVYASETAEALSPTIVESIVQQARSANARRHITGMLMFDRQRFLQVLEGERDAVSEVFCRIAKDPRHRRVVLLEAQPASERYFAAWTMGFAAADARGCELFLRFGSAAEFDPHLLSGASALGLMRALSAG